MKPTFVEQHQEMTDVAQAIVALTRKGRSGDAAELNRLRLQLSKTVTSHCGEEGALMRGVEGRMPREVVARYHSELLTWRRNLIACNSGWPPARVWGDREGFLAEFMPIASRLKERVRWEEEQFYPALRTALDAGRRPEGRTASMVR